MVDQQKKMDELVDEDGRALSFEGSDVEDVDDEFIVQNDGDGDDDEGDWEDCDDSDEGSTAKKKGAAAPSKKDKKKEGEIWDDKKDPLQEDQELEYDGSAYQMLHRTNVEWPCLSVDFLLKERCSLDGISNLKSWYPNQVNGKLDPQAGNTYRDKDGTLRHEGDRFPMEAYFVAGS